MTEIDDARLDILVLSRLASPGKKPPSRSQVVQSVARALRGCLDKSRAAAAIGDSLTRLASGGLREGKRLVPTPAGRRRVVAALGAGRSGQPLTWTAAQTAVVALALGSASGPASRKRVGDADSLRAEIVRCRKDLPEEVARTRTSALNTWAAAELGLPSKTAFTLANIRAHLLARALGLSLARDPAQVENVAVAMLANAANATVPALREALVRDWLRHARNRPTASVVTGFGPPTLTDGHNEKRRASLDRFAGLVTELARARDAARFGRNKVFIASVWERAQGVPELRALGESSFKELLVEAQRAGLLILSRADLTSVMDPDLVRQSAVTYLNAEFHFVNVEEVAS